MVSEAHVSCALFGVIVDGDAASVQFPMTVTWDKSKDRGRDGWGILVNRHDQITKVTSYDEHQDLPTIQKGDVWLGNRRAEPTTEWIREKGADTQQPYWCKNGWAYVHNGTISNDREIANAQEVEIGDRWVDSMAIGVLLERYDFEEAISGLQGSFAILAHHVSQPNVFFYAVNYKPLYVWRPGDRAYGRTIIVASQKRYFPYRELDLSVAHPVPIPQYTWGTISHREISINALYPVPPRRRVLVVCSGGLDSTVVATYHVRKGDDVRLLHFTHGAKATNREVDAVQSVAVKLGVSCEVVQTGFWVNHAQSTLTDPNGSINHARGGVTGAEFGHEWTPARNTVFISLALAYAEAHGYDVIALGTNLEESGGGYPDNEQEFINRWVDLVPYAMRPYHKIEFSQPVGTYMKHEIVRLGLELRAPLEVTWSCYENGDAHCGSCGPCFMRRTAFEMCGAEDPVFAYAR
jgi:7-cyano-7-deazaguanine synthase